MKFVDRARQSVRDLSAGRLGALGKVLPVIFLVALAWFGLRFITGGDETQALADPEIEVPSIPLDGGVANRLEELVGTAHWLLDEITDETSARQAVPKLEELNGNLDSLTRRFNRLPNSVKPELRADASVVATSIKVHLDRVYKLPGVQAILEPVLNNLLHKLTRFGR